MLGAKRATVSHDFVYYYALHKMLTSDWSNTNLTLDDVWLVGGNVRLVPVRKELHVRRVIKVRSVAINIMQFECNVWSIKLISEIHREYKCNRQVA